MSRMKDLEFEIKKLMFEMSNILETDENVDLLNLLPRSDDPSLIVRLPPGAPDRNTPKEKFKKSIMNFQKN